MLTVAVVLNYLISAGVFVVALRYLRAVPPLDYHQTVFDHYGDSTGEGHRRVLGALYTVLGAFLAGLALVTALINAFAVTQDLAWGKVAIAVIVLVAAGPTAVITRGVARDTGAKTPWQQAYAFLAMGALAFVLAFL